MDIEAVSFLAERVPHLALRDSALERCRREPLRLPATKLRVGSVRGRAKEGTPRMPAALLDARDRNARLALRGDEHGHVQDPVLLRAEQLLAVVEEDVRL